MDSEKDKKVKRIARFLELGGTMLAEHCKVCGAPRFRYQGTVICPVCDVREEEESPEPTPEVQVPEPRPSEEKENTIAEEENSTRKRPAGEKEKPLFENKKRFQAYRQKTRFGPKTLDSVDEDEKTPESAGKENLGASYEPRGTKETPLETRSLPQEVIEKQAIGEPYISEGYETRNHKDKEALEDLLFMKIISIAASIQEENDPRRISEAFKLIEDGLELIKRLKQI
jgi:UPF0148 protein